MTQTDRTWSPTQADLDWISPIAALEYRGMGATDKSFPLLYSRAAIEPHVVKEIRLIPE